jgi:metal-sulfur cluster biosynthetic enzyme
MTEEQIFAALQTVYDPEIGVNIVDLGLVYKVEIRPHEVYIELTMTTPACPLSSAITRSIEQALRQAFPQLLVVTVELVWEPLWNPEMMSPVAKQQLGWD